MLRDDPVDPVHSDCRAAGRPASEDAAREGSAHTPSSRRAPGARVFVQGPLRRGPPPGIRAGAIADGTSRGGPNGLAHGARRVIDCAERCAERGDVALFAAFILSPQNVRRRRRPFFAALHAQLLRLLEGVTSGRCLRGIRVQLAGRLDRLARKGGAAARLSRVVELLCEATAGVPAPRTTLVLGVDYDEDTALDLDLDVLIRTGMEEPGVLRLSGLRASPDMACVSTTKLWRDFGPDDLDEALASLGPRPQGRLAAGYDLSFVAGLLTALSRARLPSAVRVTLPVTTKGPRAMAAFERLVGSTLEQAGGVAVTASLEPGGRPRRFGPRDAPVLLRLVSARAPSRRSAERPAAWLAPGQSPPVFQLCDGPVGDANIHGCEPTPEGLMDGLRRALRFHSAHPPLHGAARLHRRGEEDELVAMEELIQYVGQRPDAPAEVVAAELGASREPGAALLGDVFAARCLFDARAAGLVSGEVDWRRQAAGYALTAFGIAHRPDAPGWEAAARSLAQVMLALASSDEEITDRAFDGEPRDARRARIEASIEHLVASLGGERREPPEVRGAGVLTAIARAWRAFFEQAEASGHEVLVSGVRRAAEALYRANLTELSGEDPALASLRLRPSARGARALLSRHAARAPAPITGWVRELLGEVLRGPGGAREDQWRTLALLWRLSGTAPSIGAGCALLALAATEPAGAVPAGGAEALLRAAPFIDHYFRLANDLAFVDAARGDRDDKPNALTCLIPRGLSGEARERACVRALRTCRAVAERLEAEVRSAVAELSRLWPLAGRWVERGVALGRGAYDGGHYDRLGRREMGDMIAGLSPP